MSDITLNLEQALQLVQKETAPAYIRTLGALAASTILLNKAVKEPVESVSLDVLESLLDEVQGAIDRIRSNH